MRGNERTYSVYIHISPSGKKYIGITKNTPSFRWRNGTGYSRFAFGRAIKKYGWENFQHGVIAQGLSLQEAESMEVALIAFLHTNEPEYGYNISLGGHIACPDPSDEFREKLRIANTGANNKKSIPVICIETGQTFESVHLAAKELGLKHSNILRVLSGRNKTTGGYSFDVVRDEDRKSKIKTLTREQVVSLHCKRVAVYNRAGDLIDVCESRASAGRKYGVTTAGVSDCIHNYRKSSNGYIFVDASIDYPSSVPPTPRFDGANNPSARPIDCYLADGTFFKHYEFASMARDELSLDLSSIIKVCKGKLKQHKGFVFNYSTDNNNKTNKL